MNHYKILQKSEQLVWKNLEQEENYVISREDKINEFKIQKELQNKLKYLEKCEDQAMKKEFYQVQFQKTILDSLNNIRLLNQELIILEYKDKLDNDPEIKQKHEQIKNRPVQPIQTIKIPKKDEDDRFYWNAPSNLPSFSTQHLTGLTYTQIAEEARLRVFQPGFGQPTQTMEESTQIIMDKMHHESEQQKGQKKQDTDSEDEDIADQKTLEKRAWDDWKDANEKGGGNKMR